MRVNYEESCAKAEIIGYEKVEDSNAYNGISYIKDDKKWIFDIQALMERLGITTREELEALGYNCDDYDEFVNLSLKETEVLVTRKEHLEIFGGGAVNELGLIYISDGVYMTEDGDLVDTKG